MKDAGRTEMLHVAEQALIMTGGICTEPGDSKVGRSTGGAFIYSTSTIHKLNRNHPPKRKRFTLANFQVRICPRYDEALESRQNSRNSEITIRLASTGLPRTGLSNRSLHTLGDGTKQLAADDHYLPGN